MESKLNHQTIDSYAKAVARQITQNFFKENNKIRGKQIVELTDFKQINLIVLKNLFQKWQKENAKLQSPYFDYQANEVKKALTDFMNVLSRHISISKDHFEPLCREAIKDTILLIFSPYDFYSKEINHRDESRISKQKLLDLQKYIKVNSFLLSELIENFPEKEKSFLFNDEAFELFNDVCSKSQNSPEDFQPYLKSLSDLKPLSLKDIYIEEEEEKEAFNTLNEQLRNKDKKTLADKLSRRSHKNLRKLLSLNQRFMFTNELFAGEQETFNEAIEKIDSKRNFSEAQDFINAEYANKFGWEEDSEAVEEFLELLEKRFD